METEKERALEGKMNEVWARFTELQSQINELWEEMNALRLETKLVIHLFERRIKP